jgi:large subunit ribosomal protein L22
MMEAKASLMNARISPRKARVILNMVRGQHVATVLDQLRFTRKAAAPLVSKLLASAISNAQRKKEDVDLDRLYVKTAFADKASDHHMVRWRPRAMGRATQIQKGMSHLTVIVAERED